MLAGNHEEAAKAFEATIARADLNPSPASATIRREATLGLAAVALKLDRVRPSAQTRWDEMAGKTPASSTTPLSSPTSSPLGSP